MSSEARVNGATSERAVDRRLEDRYDGGIPATFTISGSRHTTPRAAICSIDSLSASGMLISSETAPELGHYIWVDLDPFGLMRCRVVENRLGGFVCENMLNDKARERLAGWIQQLGRRAGRPRVEKRRHFRAYPRDARTTVTLEDGEIFSAMLSDVSRSGAALSSDRNLVHGMALTVGRVPATVSRSFEGGFAVAFERVLEAEEADRLVAGFEVRPVAKRNDSGK